MDTVTVAPTGGPEATPGDEAGTAPGDRRFRPDVEGLRAVAVLLVVLYHADLPGLPGGYVGVDVFFVISGFVITGLLLRERATTGRTSLLSFYGRRVRRILPAATVVIVTTVIVTYAALGVVYGNPTAVAARWTAVFLANFHFASIGTDYLASTLPPSPLQNFWSLAVEEQFYLVYPAIFLVAASWRSTSSIRARLVVILVPIIAFSLLLSAAQTSWSPDTAFFSPLTRAWELALGALVAATTPFLLRLPRPIAAVLTWMGAAGIGFAAVTYSASTPYPGVAVVVPVVGTALVIAGGTSFPRWGVESVLALGPFQWFGRLSYSLYLWHWPILIIAAEAAGMNGLPFHRALGWLALSLAAAYATHLVVENPVRHARSLVRSRWMTLALGAVLVAVSLTVASVELAVHPASPVKVTGGASNAVVPLRPDQVADMVAAAPRITSLPADLAPTLAGVYSDWGGPPGACWPTYSQTSVPACAFGDPRGTRTMVLYGDSHAGMWFDAMNLIATLSHWRLVILAKGSCPVVDLPVASPASDPMPGGGYPACSRWHTFAVNRIRQIHPDLVVITQFPETPPDGTPYSPAQWAAGTAAAIRQLPVPTDRVTVLGNIPHDPSGGPGCLSLHPTDVQACSGRAVGFFLAYDVAEQQAASSTGARYINTIPWFCSAICTDVIGRYQPYRDGFHITGTYATVLSQVLAEAIDLNSYPPIARPHAPTQAIATSPAGPAG